MPTPTPTPTPTPRPATIRDLVDVRPHPTVVQLGHLEASDAEWISESYYRTPDVDAHLAALRVALARPQGTGAFLIGQYGSGKSHFLAWLAQNVRAGRFLAPGSSGEPLHVACLSLVDYRGRVPLEDAVARTLGLAGEPTNRRLEWGRLMDRHAAGILLVVDELSEFLRAKPDPRAFTEDVRFLQFLGEWAQQHRFWIVCGMQEQIEHTGELDYGLYRKIKDRYPLRFLLTPTHVRELIRDAILVKREGYAEAARAVAADVGRALPRAPIDAENLAAMYPVHPVTIDLLEEVRDRFSQARGVVDFVVTQLAGSEERGIAPFLDRPWGDLLTPEAIVDHFRDLFEVQSEFQAIAQRLFPYYDKHAAELFERESARELALRLLRVLVLVHLSPARSALTPEEAAYWLLYRASRIDADKNIAVIRNVLARLASAGRYVAEKDGAYSLALDDDDAATLQRMLDREIAGFAGNAPAVFESLAPLLQGRAFDPFTLPREQLQHRTLRWHFHERRYAVFLGDGEVPCAEVPVLCLRLPWGSTDHAPGLRTVIPRPIALEPRHIELAALIALRGRAWSESTARRIQARLEEGARAFEADVKTSFLGARVLSPTGSDDEVNVADVRLSFAAYLERHAGALFAALYPAFAPFAPAYGPLGREVLRAFVKLALEQGVDAESSDDAVNLVREAYLVPMGVLARQGRSYVVPKNVERRELVKLVLPLLEHEPAPNVVFEHVAQPVYGLVPDQARLLLVFLLAQGEIDIVKDGKSFRELYEMLGDPLQYDRTLKVRQLGPDALRQLATLAEGLGLKTPQTWTVLAQRRTVEELRAAGRALGERLQPLLLRLAELEEGAALCARIDAALAPWRRLEPEPGEARDPLAAFQRFLAGVDSVPKLVASVADAREWPGRLERVLADSQRLRHLLAHPALASLENPALVLRLEALGSKPRLDSLDALERWVAEARALYDDYASDYRARHDAWWKQHAEHAIFSWQPPALARSRHVGASAELETIAQARARAEQRRCRGRVELAFQPICTCGFGGERNPVAEEIARFDAARGRIIAELERFFAQPEVKRRMHAWVDAGLDLAGGEEARTATLAYLEGKRALPVAGDIALLDRHLAGVEVVHRVPLARVAEALGERTLDRRGALAAFEELLATLGEGRLRFELGEPTAAPDDLAGWCVRHALKHAEPLPPSLRTADLGRVALAPADVSSSALARLDGLGLGEALERRVLSWAADGSVPLPDGAIASPRVRALRERGRLAKTCSAETLRRQAALLYEAHTSLAPILGQGWLTDLGTLAHTSLDPLPAPLTDLLRERASEQWLIIDCLGVPLLEALLPVLERALGGWRVADTHFALVSETTTTSACYSELIEAGLVRAFEKIDAIDALLHARFEPFADLTRLAAAELEIACRRCAERLDAAAPLIVFADHGFRIAHDGRQYVHGGSSTLERLVPVVDMRPAR